MVPARMQSSARNHCRSELARDKDLADTSGISVWRLPLRHCSSLPGNHQRERLMPELPRGRYLRSGRFSESGRIYLVTSVTHNREQVFNDWKLGRLVVNEFRAVQSSGAADSLAWVIMPDHIHWLLELTGGELTRILQGVKSRSARAINQSRGTHRQVWQRGFHDRALRREDDLLMMARYIVANPLRAGLVKRVGDYPLWDASWF